VFNIAGTGFDVTSGGVTASSRFIFATEDGTISGWNGGSTTVLAVDHSHDGAVSGVFGWGCLFGPRWIAGLAGTSPLTEVLGKDILNQRLTGSNQS
jgi:hypothetical protein